MCCLYTVQLIIFGFVTNQGVHCTMYIHSKVHLLFHRIVRSCLILSRFLVTLISSQEEHLKEIQSLQAIIETLKKEQEESKLRLVGHFIIFLKSYSIAELRICIQE